MRTRIGYYRKDPIGSGEDPVIGCLFVRDVRFFPEEDNPSAAPNFARNIVQGKSYNLAEQTVAPYLGNFSTSSWAPR